MIVVRFLKTTASDAPGYPFLPGQTIYLTGQSSEVQRWIKEGLAEIVPDEKPEVAVEPTHERAVLPRGRHVRP